MKNHNNAIHPSTQHVNPFMPTVAFNICCPRDCVSRYNGGTSGVPLKPLRDDSALRALSFLRGLRGGTRGSHIMPRDVSLSDSKCWNGGHEWVKEKSHVVEAYLKLG